MRTSDLIKMGLKNLSRRKARTALTVVGVVIGTISIVVMISIGLGMNANFTKYVMEQGSLTTITVDKIMRSFDESTRTGQVIEQEKLDKTVVEKMRQIPHVKAVTPVYMAYAQIYSRGCYGFAQLYAMDLTALKELEFPATTLGEYPVEKNSDAIIFGSDTLGNFYSQTSWNAPPISVDPEKDKLFLEMNVNEFERDWEAKIPRNYVKNPVVMEKTGSQEGYDWSVYMDIGLYERYYTEFVKKCVKKVSQGKAMKALNEYGQVKVSIDNVKNVKKVQDAIEEMGYRSSSLSSMFESTQKTANMLQMVLGGIGAVAMLVSAISIANTMVMSIYERTKEIGVMKVLGCLVSDIRKMFLFEAGTIGLIGGVIGIGVSYIASFCINKFGGPLFAQLMSGGPMFGQEGEASQYSVIPVWLPFLAILFAIGIGVLSGYFPARRATKISAIEAMKSEG